MSNIVTTRKPWTFMTLLLVTREAKGSSGWQPKYVDYVIGIKYIQVCIFLSYTHYQYERRNGLNKEQKFNICIYVYRY